MKGIGKVTTVCTVQTLAVVISGDGNPGAQSYDSLVRLDKVTRNSKSTLGRKFSALLRKFPIPDRKIHYFVASTRHVLTLHTNGFDPSPLLSISGDKKSPRDPGCDPEDHASPQSLTIISCKAILGNWTPCLLEKSRAERTEKTVLEESKLDKTRALIRC